jgi:hypothetical protein
MGRPMRVMARPNAVAHPVRTTVKVMMPAGRPRSR